jgi:hypothetical protein
MDKESLHRLWDGQQSFCFRPAIVMLAGASIRSKRVPPPLEVRTITLIEGRELLLPAPELQTGACIH